MATVRAVAYSRCMSFLDSCSPPLINALTGWPLRSISSRRRAPRLKVPKSGLRVAGTERPVRARARAGCARSRTSGRGKSGPSELMRPANARRRPADAAGRRAVAQVGALSDRSDAKIWSRSLCERGRSEREGHRRECRRRLPVDVEALAGARDVRTGPPRGFSTLDAVASGQRRRPGRSTPPGRRSEKEGRAESTPCASAAKQSVVRRQNGSAAGGRERGARGVSTIRTWASTLRTWWTTSNRGLIARRRSAGFQSWPNSHRQRRDKLRQFVEQEIDRRRKGRRVGFVGFNANGQTTRSSQRLIHEGFVELEDGRLELTDEGRAAGRLVARRAGGRAPRWWNEVLGPSLQGD